MFDAMSDMSYHTVIECEIYGDVVSIVFVPYWELCAGSILASDVVVHYCIHECVISGRGVGGSREPLR